MRTSVSMSVPGRGGGLGAFELHIRLGLHGGLFRGGFSALNIIPGVTIALFFFSSVEFLTHKHKLCTCSLTAVMALLLVFMLFAKARVVDLHT